MTEIAKIDVKIKSPHLKSMILEQIQKFPMRYALSDDGSSMLCITDEKPFFLESYSESDTKNVLFMGSAAEVASLPQEAIEKYSIPLPSRIGDVMKKMDHYLFAMGAERDLDVVIGDMRLQSQTKLLSNIAHGQKLPLTDKETEILTYLYQQEGENVPRDVLLKQIWQFHPDVTTHTLETHMYRLRQKFQKLDLDDEQYLKSDAGGYALQIPKS